MRGRGLVATSIGLVVLLVGAWGIGIATSGEGSIINPVASLANLKENKVVPVALPRDDAFLVYDEGEVFALSADAQHLGDDVVFCESSQLFESPAHGEKFDIRGFYYGGPAQRGLARYPVRIEGDEIFLDLDHPVEGPERGEGPTREPQGPFCIPT